MVKKRARAPARVAPLHEKLKDMEKMNGAPTGPGPTPVTVGFLNHLAFFLAFRSASLSPVILL